jgi:hypothetical protein
MNFEATFVTAAVLSSRSLLTGGPEYHGAENRTDAAPQYKTALLGRLLESSVLCNIQSDLRQSWAKQFEHEILTIFSFACLDK